MYHKILIFILFCSFSSLTKQTKCPAAINKQYTKAGIYLYNQKRALESVECFEMALQTTQSDTTLNNLAIIFTRLQDWNAADKTLQRGLTLYPKSNEIFKSYIQLFFVQKRYFDALSIARKWELMVPDGLESNTYLASTLYEIGNKIESLFYYKKSLAIYPNHVPSLINAAVIHNSIGEHSAAISLATAALRIDSNVLEGYVTLGAAYISIGKYKEATVSLENALKINPNHSQSKCKLINARRHLCNWTQYDEDVTELRRILRIEASQKDLMTLENRQQCNSPGNLLFFELPLELLKETAFISARKLVLSLAQQRTFTKNHLIDKQSNPSILPNLKIGFVSFNFNNHPASHILAPLFDYLSNRDDTQVFAYSLNPYNDTWSEKIRRSVNRFQNISHLDTPSISEIILHDEIDILVDLMGYTVGGRMEIFASHPSPLQISYLGYPGSIGDTSVLEYIICDVIACDVSNAEKEFAEKLIYLPTPYFPAPSFDFIEPKTREIFTMKQKLKIPKGKFVYCCLSKLSKLTPQIYRIWGQILLESKNAILWLVSWPIESVENLKSFSRQLGVADQILFTPPLPRPEYLKYAPYLCDLFLDTVPYSAHTVAAEMLSRGLPLLSKLGFSFAGRVGASLLTSINLPKLVAKDMFEYKNMAINLYQNRTKLSEIRRLILDEMRTKNSNAFNFRKFGESFYSGIKMAWDNFLEGNSPHHIFVDKKH